MKIEILGWNSEGFRSPDSNVDITNGNLVPKFTLLQMPNGTGKTTTLELLRATLSGDLSGLEKKGLAQLARTDSHSQNGKFHVKLKINGDKLDLVLDIDFFNANHRFSSTSTIYGGSRDGHHIPTEARKFFSKEFLDLFLFDAEFQDAIFNSDSDAADRAVDALCQIYLFENITQNASMYLRGESKKDSTKTDKGLSEIRKKIQEAEKRKKGLLEAKEKCNVFVTEHSTEEKRLQAKIQNLREKDAGTNEDLKQATAEEEFARNERQQAESELFSFLQQIYFVTDEHGAWLTKLTDSLEQNKLPETTSRQFFLELARSEDCVCGREIGNDERNYIQANAEQYLGENTAGVMNAVKNAIESNKGLPRNSSDLDTFYDDLRKKIGDEVNAVAEKEQKEKASNDAGADKLEEVVRKHTNLVNNLDMENSKLTRLNKPHDSRKPFDEIDRIFNIASIDAFIDEYSKREAQVTNTVETHNKITIVKQILESAATKARSKIKAELTAKCNERLKELLVNDPLEIESIGDSIKLRGQDGASAGQQLTVAYTFLMSLLERGGHQFPLIVDSPAGPLDRTLRASVGALIPKICDQYIAFTINTEHPGFVTALKASGETRKLLTLFRKTVGTERFMENLPKGKFTETPNGVLVDDEDYFDFFDLSEEEK